MGAMWARCGGSEEKMGIKSLMVTLLELKKVDFNPKMKCLCIIYLYSLSTSYVF